MSRAEKPLDALVVGAGPSGLTMASELIRHGCSCRIIDKSPKASTHSKALGIHARTLEVFRELGIVDSVLEAGLKIRGVNIYSGRKRLGRLNMESIDSPYPYAVGLPQSETERILTALLAGRGKQPEREVELLDFRQDGDGVCSRLRHSDGREETVPSRWLVGCDGAHSTVRKGLNIPFGGETYENTWTLADLKVDWSLPGDEIHIFVHPSGVLAFFPMPGERDRFVLNLPGVSPATSIPTPSLQEFEREIGVRAIPGIRLSDPDWMTNFRLHHRRARDFQKGRCFLVGDSAHIHSPAGGQGMNTGIQDAYNLAWKMGLVAAGKANPALLDTYSEERIPVAESVLRDTDRLTRMVEMRNPFLCALRNHLLPLITGLRPFQNRVPPHMAQLGFNYRRSRIVAEVWKNGSTGIPAGERAPDALLRARDDSNDVHVIDLLGKRHVLLYFSGPDSGPEQAQEAALLARAIGAGVGPLLSSCFIFHGSHRLPKEVSSLQICRDPDLKCHQKYGAQRPSLYLIRPDLYVAFRCSPISADSVTDYLDRCLE